MNTFKTALIAGVATLIVAACANDGRFEDAGEDIDEAIEDIQD